MNNLEQAFSTVQQHLQKELDEAKADDSPIRVQKLERLMEWLSEEALCL